MIKRTLALLLLAFTIAGCNTMAGMGRDIERGGDEITEEAREAKRSLY